MTTPPVRLSVVEASATIVAPRYWLSAVDASMLIAPLIVLVPEIARTAPWPSMPRLTLLLPGLRAMASATVMPSATSRAEFSTPDKVTPPVAVPRAFAAVTRTAPWRTVSAPSQVGLAAPSTRVPRSFFCRALPTAERVNGLVSVSVLPLLTSMPELAAFRLKVREVLNVSVTRKPLVRLFVLMRTTLVESPRAPSFATER